APPGSQPRRRSAQRRPRWALPLCALLLAAVILTVVLAARFAGKGKALPAGPPWVIALDAGHGGGDVGATGLIYETELTEQTVAALYRLLEADENFTPVLCRAYDEGKTPRQRALTAKAKGAALLFSIHGNASEDSSITGFECFPVPPGRDWHAESYALAGLVAGEMAAAGARLRGENGVRYAYYDADGTKWFREASDTLVYSEESFGVVEYPECMAVLVEQCFITSEADMAKFGTAAGCEAAAQCYYRAICRYFETA
ncbi:N-acetylmuramoyl-L-alanine amidase, partial [Ruminococcaceae bacterium OttesenSCG-928-A11]|nr:N-acetylmuramoyl-L-alanine amidase [Ruminococcaceae bacterium OttesenSCG-928-A11]